MEEKLNLYFIAIIPPEETCREIIAFKEDFALRFESKAALKVVPHITLKAPFKLEASQHDTLVQWFENMPVPFESFRIELKDFGSFPKNHAPVVFVQPLLNTTLVVLQKDIIRNFHDHFPDIEIIPLEKQFHPHMTIAYRDLKPHLFKEAWKEYQTKKYHATFEVQNFHLLQHDGRKWNVINTYLFGNI